MRTWRAETTTMESRRSVKCAAPFTRPTTIRLWRTFLIARPVRVPSSLMMITERSTSVISLEGVARDALAGKLLLSFEGGCASCKMELAELG